MPNVQIFIPGGAQQGNAVSINDFAAAAEEQLKRIESDASVSDDLKQQASAAVECAIALVEQEFVGTESVIGVISTRINPDAIPVGSGHIVSIELSSRAEPTETVAPPQREAEIGAETPNEAGQIPADGTPVTLNSEPLAPLADDAELLAAGDNSEKVAEGAEPGKAEDTAAS